MKKVTLLIPALALLSCFSAKSQLIYTAAGDGTSGFSGDGNSATSAELSQPDDVKFDTAGNFYLIDALNYRIRRVDHISGNITTVAGTSTGYSGDGGAAMSAQFSVMSGIAIDKAGNIYIADRDNNRIRKIDKSTGNVNTICGNGTASYGGDGAAATAAMISGPRYVALDASNNVYFTDTKNNRVRMINVSNGNVYTVAGTGTAGSNGDGGLATAAQLNGPYGVSIAPSGDIYICDQGNNKVRKIDHTTGNITTIAGTGGPGYTGDGNLATAATFNGPATVAVDVMGNVYVSDTYNNVIRKVAYFNNKVYTIAGNGVAGSSGDGGQATSAEMNEPLGVGFQPKTGALYYADWGSYKIRYLTSPLAVNELSTSTDIQVYPNPASDVLFVKGIETAGNDVTIKVTDILGHDILSQRADGSQSIVKVDVSSLSTGLYFINVTSNEHTYVTKFIRK